MTTFRSVERRHYSQVCQLLFIDLSYIDVTKKGDQIVEAGVCWANAPNACYSRLLIVINSSYIGVVLAY